MKLIPNLSFEALIIITINECFILVLLYVLELHIIKIVQNKSHAGSTSSNRTGILNLKYKYGLDIFEQVIPIYFFNYYL